MNSPAPEYNFDILEDFFDWLEGTTHGAFLRTNIPKVEMERLHKTYPGKVRFYGLSIQAVARKL